MGVRRVPHANLVDTAATQVALKKKRRIHSAIYHSDALKVITGRERRERDMRVRCGLWRTMDPPTTTPSICGRLERVHSLTTSIKVHHISPWSIELRIYHSQTSCTRYAAALLTHWYWSSCIYHLHPAFPHLAALPSPDVRFRHHGACSLTALH
jgi:hypothetical protein